MATLYCNLCERMVEAKRHVGIGTLILVILTGLIWVIVIPFYQKKCSICKSPVLTKPKE